MSSLETRAQPPLEFIEPAFNPLVLRLVRSLLPVWLRWRTGITQVQVHHIDILIDLYRQFQAGQIRFMLAFRHPSTDDPLCLAHLLWREVPRAAQQQGNPLEQPIHVHLIYDRGIPLWAGQLVGWLNAKLGGIPIRRGKADRQGLRTIRQYFAQGLFPMAAAPEGATNGHNDIVSPLEPGIAQFGFWCAEDLQKAGRSEQVWILPIGIQYRSSHQPWQALDQLLGQLEIDSGLVTPERSESELTGLEQRQQLQDDQPLNPEQEVALYRRLFRLGEHLLSLMEAFYRRFYGQDLGVPAGEKSGITPEQRLPADLSPSVLNEYLARRLQQLLNGALTVAEQYFELEPKGSLTDRCRRLEQAGWDRIYREDVQQIDQLSAVERGLADRVAEEANLRLWHMRLVETFVAVTGRYVIEKPTFDRFAETTLLLWDIVTRIKGENPFPRPRLAQRQVQMTVGQPISVSACWDHYQSNRRQAITALTQTLQAALEAMVIS